MTMLISEQCKTTAMYNSFKQLHKKSAQMLV